MASPQVQAVIDDTLNKIRAVYPPQCLSWLKSYDLPRYQRICEQEEDVERAAATGSVEAVKDSCAALLWVWSTAITAYQSATGR